MVLLFCLFVSHEFLELGPENLTVKTKALSRFTDLAEIDRIIQLESSDHSILASIDKVVINKTDNNILVLDRSSGVVLCFDSDGNFLNQVSRKGFAPGEYIETIEDFDILENGKIVIASSKKLLIFDAASTFLSETKLRHSPDSPELMPREVSAWSGKIFVSSRLVRHKVKHGVYAFNQNLELEHAFQPYDTKNDIYRFNNRRNLLVHRNRLIYNPDYELGFYIYYLSNTELPPCHYRFPENNREKMAQLWATQPFKEETRTSIKKYVHRFSGMYHFGDAILFLEFSKDPWIHRMVSLKGRTFVRYQGYHFFSFPKHQGKELLLYGLVGNHKDLAIGVVEHDEYFDNIKNNYPKLRNIDFDDSHNPILLMLRPKI